MGFTAGVQGYYTYRFSVYTPLLICILNIFVDFFFLCLLCREYFNDFFKNYQRPDLKTLRAKNKISCKIYRLARKQILKIETVSKIIFLSTCPKSRGNSELPAACHMECSRFTWLASCYSLVHTHFHNCTRLSCTSPGCTCKISNAPVRN